METASILKKTAPPTSKKNSPKNTRASFQEPLESPQQEAWELAKMTKEQWEQWETSQHRIRTSLERWLYEDVRNTLADEWNSLGYWQGREDILQNQRFSITRKGPLSGEDIHRLNELEDELWECDEHIQDIWAEEEEEEEGRRA